ncbi:MAG: ABC transporter substrate-binding protein [Gemmatimonadales bacterium]|jgi:hypothetical protein
MRFSPLCVIRSSAGRLDVLAAIAAVASLMMLGCRPPPQSRPGPVAGVAEGCVIQPPPAESPNALSVALPGEIDPSHAPQPENAAERVVFRHLYETLIRVDCGGRIRPGLAESWHAREGGGGGRAWEFVLRKDARFWDGTPVTAAGVAAGWQSGAAGTRARAAGLDSTDAESDRRLVVYMDRPHRDVPRVFADLGLAAARPSADSPWPRGTGPYAVEAYATPAEGSTAVRTVNVSPLFQGAGPDIDFRAVSGAETRDLLEDGVDVLLTADRAVIDYAATRPEFVDTALAWNRTYVLLSTTRVREVRGGGTASDLPADLLDAIARDAVSGDARGHRPPSWWDDLGSCSGVARVLSGLPPVPRGAYRSGPRRIVYALGDPVAQGLAERIVALAGAGPGSSAEAVAFAAAVPGLLGADARLLAQGLRQEEFAASLREGDDFAYVVAVPRQVLDPCFDISMLVSRAEWLAMDDQAGLASAIIPLVDTRQHLIARRGAVALAVDWDGTVLVAGAAVREK